MRATHLPEPNDTRPSFVGAADHAEEESVEAYAARAAKKLTRYKDKGKRGKKHRGGKALPMRPILRVSGSIEWRTA